MAMARWGEDGGRVYNAILLHRLDSGSYWGVIGLDNREFLAFNGIPVDVCGTWTYFSACIGIWIGVEAKCAKFTCVFVYNRPRYRIDIGIDVRIGAGNWNKELQGGWNLRKDEKEVSFEREKLYNMYRVFCNIRINQV